MLIARADAQRTVVRRAMDKAAAVVICGRRKANRYRLPLQAAVPPGPTLLDVAGERAALLHRTTPVGEVRAFPVVGGLSRPSIVSTFGSGSHSEEASVTGVRSLAS